MSARQAKTPAPDGAPVLKTPRDPAVTSRMMATVHNKDSKAELILRRALHARGLRYRLHARNVIGRPDITFPTWRLAVFVDGDFWHGNAWRLRGLNSLDELFPTRKEFWIPKIQRTMERDLEVTEALRAKGWRVLRFWESDLLQDALPAVEHVLNALNSAGYTSPRTVGAPARFVRDQ